MRIISCLVAAAMLGVAADPTGKPHYQHPLIENYGGAVALPNAAEPPRRETKLLLDFVSDETKDGVVKGLNRAATLANLYALGDAGPDRGMKLAVVIHGAATKAVLSDEAYARHVGAENNPNRELVEQLKSAGVEIYVCGQALAHSKYATTDVLPEVTIAVSAATAAVNKQLDGYIYVP